MAYYYYFSNNQKNMNNQVYNNVLIWNINKNIINTKMKVSIKVDFLRINKIYDSDLKFVQLSIFEFVFSNLRNIPFD